VEAISTSKNRAKAPVKVSFVGYEESAWKAIAAPAFYNSRAAAAGIIVVVRCRFTFGLTAGLGLIANGKRAGIANGKRHAIAVELKHPRTRAGFTNDAL